MSIVLGGGGSGGSAGDVSECGARFVDSISNDPTVRLDLDDMDQQLNGTWLLLKDGTEIGMPEFRRSIAGSMLRDGEEVSASAYGNRILTLHLFTVGVTQSALGAALQTLHRELDRERNILEWRPTDAVNPVFFRTFRTPPEEIEATLSVLNHPSGLSAEGYFVTVPILAEPFAYGVMESVVVDADVNNDPAAASNGLMLDITGILGEIPTPAQIVYEDAAAVSALLTIGVRARGTPTNFTHYEQAEDMTQGTDTTVQANDATASGAGSNYSRCTFGTNDITVARLTEAAFLGADGTDVRGIYRLFQRLRRNGGAATDDFALYGELGHQGAQIPVLNLTTSWQFIDLGLFHVPPLLAQPPITDGYSGVEVDTFSPSFKLYARRDSGTGNLDLDYTVAVPADARDGYLEVDVGGLSDQVGATEALVVDGPQDVVYRRDSSGNVLSTDYPWKGGAPLLVPNQTNRWIILRPRTAADDRVADDCVISVNYWPRYLFIRS
jgi:hypothetical protein